MEGKRKPNPIRHTDLLYTEQHIQQSASEELLPEADIKVEINNCGQWKLAVKVPWS